MYELNRTDSVASEAAVLVGVLLPDRKPTRPPLEELEGLAETAGVRVVGPADPAPRSARRRHLSGPAARSRNCTCWPPRPTPTWSSSTTISAPARPATWKRPSDVKVLDRTELILDIFASRAQTHAGPAGRRTGPAGILDAAAEADVDAPFAAEEGHRPARAGRKAVGRRPPAGREPHQRPARGSCTPSNAARSARWPRRRDLMTVSLVGYTNAGKSTLMNALTGADVFVRGRAVRHARHPHPPLAVARLGAGAAERHGRLHPRPAAPFDRQLQGHAGRGPAGRPAAARGRRRAIRPCTSRSPRPTACWRRSASSRRTRCW